MSTETALESYDLTNKASIEITALHVKTFSDVCRSGVPDCLRQNSFLLWHRILMVPQFGICLMSPF